VAAPTVIELPEPCVVVLIGAAGAGKSTFAARHFAPAEILSSDALRAMVSGSESDQRATRTAFSILHRQLGKRLIAGRTTVIDATNVTPYARRSVLRAAAATRTPVIAIVLDLDRALVIERNAARAGRVVPEEAVRHQLAHLARAMAPGVLEAEGFTAVHHIRTATELDGAQVRRHA
jgi:predicted kinase